MADSDTRENNPADILKYPADSEPTPRMSVASALCSIGHTPLIMTGALIQVLRQHFADADNIMSPTLRQYLEREGAWSDTSRSLAVEAITRYTPDLVEQRPAVIVKDNDWKMESIGIGNLSGIDVMTGTHSFESLWIGSHTLFVVCKLAPEAQQIAYEVARTLLYSSRQLLQSFNLYMFKLTQVGSLMYLKEATKRYAVPITVTYAAMESWFTVQDAPKLKKIQFKFSELLATAFSSCQSQI